MPRLRCPACASTRVASIAYGEPSQDAADDERAERVLLGGCVLGLGRPDGTDPSHGCFACGARWGVYAPPGAGSGPSVAMREDTFVVAKNPDPESALPYLVRFPLEGGLVLKAREAWPRTGRVYCHPTEEALPADAEVVEEIPVKYCARRSAALVDLVLDRPREQRSQLLFTSARGRRAIFWQTQKIATKGSPGGRVPRRKVAVGRFEITVDTRERYAFKFEGRDVALVKAALAAGDYGVRRDGALLAAVERKSLEDLMGSLSDGKLGFQLGRLAELPRAALVVEGSYPALVEAPRAPSGWLTDVLARLQIRYPTVPIVFAHARKFAEEWTFRYLAAVLDDDGE